MKTDFRVAIGRYYITQLLRDRVGITLDPDHEAQECQPLLDYPLFFQDLSVFSTIEYSNPSQSYIMFMFHWMFHLNVTPHFQFEQAAYEMAFMPHGFTPRQFLKVVDAASGRIEEAVCGTYLCRQGGMLPGMFQEILPHTTHIFFVDLRLPGFETGEQKKWVHYLMEGEAMLIDKEDLSEMQMSMIAHGWYRYQMVELIYISDMSWHLIISRYMIYQTLMARWKTWNLFSAITDAAKGQSGEHSSRER